MSLADKLEAFFKAHPNTWVDGHVLQGIAGSYGGWSARVRDLRKRGMTIENRQRKVRGYITILACGVIDKHYTVSEYRFVPSPVVAPGDAHDANQPFALR